MDSIQNYKHIAEEIKIYCMNSKIYGGDKKSIRTSIEKINKFLLYGDCEEEGKDIFNAFKILNVGDDVNIPINLAIRKSIGSERGISATKGYKETYFNEIIQNANDLDVAEEVNITISEEKEDFYSIEFEYEDEGFKIENLVSFLDTEISSKDGNIVSTGKHGVGIKSLFYFIDYMKIESNVDIEFNINRKVRKESELGFVIDSVNSNLTYNKEWNKKTKLKILFNKNVNSNIFNVDKLKQFAQLCINESVSKEHIIKFFYTNNLNEMIFDIRSFLFTDKNKCKKKGIKNFNFFNKKNSNKKIFSINAEETDYKLCDTNFSVYKNKLQYKISDNDVKNLDEFIVFKYEPTNKSEQNTSVALNIKGNLDESNRFYSTYFIIEDKIFPSIGALINTGYSNITRNNICDEEDEKKKIIENIDKIFSELYKFMCCEKIGKSNLGKDISILFHKILFRFLKEPQDMKLNPYRLKISNRFLPKYIGNDDKKYITFFSSEKVENYQKIVAGETKETMKKINEFIKKYIFKEDSLRFDNDLFIPGIKEIYIEAIKDDKQYKLKQILNLAGDIRSLIYYRITDRFPESKDFMLLDKQVDKWHDSLTDKEYVKYSFKIIGRYKLHQYIDSYGEIKGASFKEYLFNDNIEKINSNYLSFAKKQKELYDIEYRVLKERLMNLVVNRKNGDCKGLVFNKATTYFASFKQYECKNCKGYICFYSSTHQDSKLFYEQKDANVYAYRDDGRDIGNSIIFGNELCKKLVTKLAIEQDLRNNCCFFEGSFMIVDDNSFINILSHDFKRTNPYINEYRGKKKFINLSFLQNIKINNVNDYEFYLDNFYDAIIINDEKFYGKESEFKFNICFENIKYCDLIILYKYIYQRIKKGQIIKNISIKDIEKKDIHNRCTNELKEFVEKATGYDFILIQVNKVFNFKCNEVMYLSSGKGIKFLYNNEFINVGDFNENQVKKKVYVLYSNNIKLNDAIIKVVGDLIGNSNSIIDFIKSYISNGNAVQLSAEEYDRFLNNNVIINKRARMIKNFNEFSNGKFTYRDIKKLLISRGCNNGKCSLCNSIINENNSKILICKNSNEQTNKKYKNILLISCKICFENIEKSLEEAELDESLNKVIVKCKAENSFEKKSLKIVTTIPPYNVLLMEKFGFDTK